MVLIAIAVLVIRFIRRRRQVQSRLKAAALGFELKPQLEDTSVARQVEPMALVHELPQNGDVHEADSHRAPLILHRSELRAVSLSSQHELEV